MRPILLCFVLLLSQFSPSNKIVEPLNQIPVSGKPSLEVASYNISVRLDAERKTLDGRETITYLNSSAAPIPDLVFHLYLNAFKDSSSVFLRESNGLGRGQVFDPANSGWIAIDHLRVVDGADLTVETLEDGTLARAVLPQALASGSTLVLELEFTVQLPLVVARTGWALDDSSAPFFLVAQWFPKLGVWQHGAWNAYPLHANSEFYADFGDYSVAITLPGDYLTAASGLPGWVAKNDDGTQTVTYHAADVVDFTWAASKNLLSAVRRVGETEIVYTYLPEHAWSVSTALDAAVLALKNYAQWYGAYPYPRLTVLDVPEAGTGMGGMEYPTLITAGAGPSPTSGGFFGGGSQGLEMLVFHEVAHQWWQSLVATNEAEEPWLDEGFADYSTARLMLQEYGIDAAKFDQGSYGNDYVDRRRPQFLSQPDLPMLQKAWDFNRGNYVIGAYAKPTLALLTLESVIGSEAMLRALHTYFERFHFAHPTTADFRAVVAENTHQDVRWFFDGLVTGRQTLNYAVKELKSDTFTLTRSGLAIPVPVEVTFADGTLEELTWDASSAEKTFAFPGKSSIQSVVIDPQHTRYIELEWKDNQLENPGAAQPAGTTVAAPDNPTAVASYSIDVRLDEATRQISGWERITYLNTTSTPIPDLVFHLYLNAFKNEDTIFMKEAGPEHRGFGYDAKYPGWIEVKRLRYGGGDDIDLHLESDGTLARATLPAPLKPGDALTVDVEFTAQLPRVFARTGWALDREGDLFFMVGQWFPKLGVWQAGGWNAYAFHANSEFFADFGSYDVRITLPERFHTGATGEEVSNLPNQDGTRTVTYHADRVIDFAWTASPNFSSASARAGEVEITYLYLPEHAWSAQRELDVAVRSVKRYSEWFGAYAYSHLTLVDPPDSGQGAGGMEYPTLVTLGTLDITGLSQVYARSGWERSMEMVAAHEIAHQWWQTMVATNEAEEPWLDEGFADYSTVRLLQVEYGSQGGLVDFAGMHASYLDYRRAEYIALPDVAIAGKAWDFNTNQYGIAAYSKPAVSLITLQNVLGEARMDALLQAYFQQWRFGHPTAKDFQVLAVQTTGQPLDWFFGDAVAKNGLVHGKGTLNYIAQAIGPDWLVVKREGSLAIPVEILVNFSDGSKGQVHWDGQESPKTFHFDKALRSFEIDAQHRLAVELVWADNGLANETDWSAWLAVAGRLVYRIEDWLLLLGGL
jgi:aminopeptidase N